MAVSSRGAALKVLERCRRDGAFSDSLLSVVLVDSGLSVKDRALVSRLTYGVLQNTILLDFYIRFFCDGDKKLEPKVRDILRLSLYQILLMDKIPDHAAVSEGVELCKTLGYSHASGFVNAILRRAIRSRDSLPEPSRGDVAEYLSIRFSTPKDLVGLLISDLGEEEAASFLEASNNLPPITIQPNTIKTSADQLLRELETEDIICEPHKTLPEAINITAAGDLTAISSFTNGYFLVQDAAARLAIMAAAPKPGQRVLDICSAPGGKSFAAAIAMENHGEIISCDVHENKLSRVEKGAGRLGINIISTQMCDASEYFEDFDSSFDIVIADLPCSGLGVIRKKPDIRGKSLKELENLPQLQLKILENASRYVKPDSVLLYSTCTVLRRENQGIIDVFLEKHTDFSREAFELPLPLGVVSDGEITLYPNIHDTDGFYFCKLRRRG